MKVKQLLLASTLVIGLAGCASQKGGSSSQNTDAFPNEAVDEFFQKTTKFPEITGVHDYTYETYNVGDSYSVGATTDIKFMEFTFEGDQTDAIANNGFDIDGWSVELNQTYLYLFGLYYYEAYDDYLDYYVVFYADDENDNTVMDIYDYTEANGCISDILTPCDSWVNLDARFLGLDSVNTVVPEYPNATNLYIGENLYDDGSLYYGYFAFKGQHAEEYSALLTGWTWDSDYSCYVYMIDEKIGYEMDLMVSDYFDSKEKEYYTLLTFSPYKAGANDSVENPTWDQVTALWTSYTSILDKTWTLPDLSSVSNKLTGALYLAYNDYYYGYFGLIYEGNACTSVSDLLKTAGYKDEGSYDYYGYTTYCLSYNEETYVTICFYDDYDETDVAFYTYSDVYDYFQENYFAD